MWGIFGKPLKRAIRDTTSLHAVLTICLRFWSILDGACVACCLFLSTGSCHVCIQIHATCCCFHRCTTEAFGAQKSTIWGCRLGAGESGRAWQEGQKPRTAALFVLLKSGYSEGIAWCKVRLTKQRHVDLTTDGLWAMPLNTGWAPVTERRLQDWEKLKKFVPIHKQGDVCPNAVPAHAGNDNNDNNFNPE